MPASNDLKVSHSGRRIQASSATSRRTATFSGGVRGGAEHAVLKMLAASRASGRDTAFRRLADLLGHPLKRQTVSRLPAGPVWEVDYICHSPRRFAIASVDAYTGQVTGVDLCTDPRNR